MPLTRDDKITALEARLPALHELLDPCRLCPRNCRAARRNGDTGECGIGAELVVASIGLHHGEEYPLSGTRGSGTIFLSGCNLHCLYCQNWTISQAREGEVFSADDLAAAMLELQRAGAHNINWVSPTHVVPLLCSALLIAWRRGLTLPLVYNTGGYDALDVLHLLDGLVDIYMPDMKYGDAAAGERLSGVPDYPQRNQAAVREMYRQAGPLECDADGVAVRGLLVRHMVLPDQLAGSAAVFEFLARELPGPADINIMAQYRPCHLAGRHVELCRPLQRYEFEQALRAAALHPSLRRVR